MDDIKKGKILFLMCSLLPYCKPLTLGRFTLGGSLIGIFFCRSCKELVSWKVHGSRTNDKNKNIKRKTENHHDAWETGLGPYTTSPCTGLSVRQTRKKKEKKKKKEKRKRKRKK